MFDVNSLLHRLIFAKRKRFSLFSLTGRRELLLVTALGATACKNLQDDDEDEVVNDLLAATAPTFRGDDSAGDMQGSGTFSGADTIGADTSLYLYGGSEADTITGSDGEGSDFISGGEGADVLIGRGGDDALWGGVGNDILWGGLGTDNLRGGDGDDIILLIGEGGSYSSIPMIPDTQLAGTWSGNLDLNAMLGLTTSDVNDRTAETSDYQHGEIIDGGEGMNTLLVFGRVDLTQATRDTFTQIETISLNSELVLSENNLNILSDVTVIGQSLTESSIVIQDSDNDGMVSLSAIGTLNNLRVSAESMRQTATFTIDIDDLAMQTGSNIEIDGNVMLMSNSDFTIDKDSGGTFTIDDGMNIFTFTTSSTGNDAVVVDTTAKVTLEGMATTSVMAEGNATLTPNAAESEYTLGNFKHFDGTGKTENLTITGTDAANTLTGGAGDDTFTGGDGADTIDGGDGTDTASGYSGSFTLSATANEIIVDSNVLGRDTLTNIETITLASASDIDVGNLANTDAFTIQGSGGTDIFTFAENHMGNIRFIELGNMAQLRFEGTGWTFDGTNLQSEDAHIVATRTGGGSFSIFTDRVLLPEQFRMMNGNAFSDPDNTFMNFSSLVNPFKYAPEDNGMPNMTANVMDSEFDVANFESAMTAVVADFSVTTPMINMIEFADYEGVLGGSGNDTFTANASTPNHFSGNGGTDTFHISGGLHYIDGGDGTGDTASFTISNNPVTLNLVTNSYKIGTETETGTIQNIETYSLGTGENDLVTNLGGSYTAGTNGSFNNGTINISGGIKGIDASMADEAVTITTGSMGGDYKGGSATTDTINFAVGTYTIANHTGSFDYEITGGGNTYNVGGIEHLSFSDNADTVTISTDITGEIKLGGGADMVTISTGVAGTIDLGAGEAGVDTLTFGMGSSGTYTLRNFLEGDMIDLTAFSTHKIEVNNGMVQVTKVTGNVGEEDFESVPFLTINAGSMATDEQVTDGRVFSTMTTDTIAGQSSYRLHTLETLDDGVNIGGPTDTTQIDIVQLTDTGTTIDFESQTISTSTPTAFDRNKLDGAIGTSGVDTFVIGDSSTGSLYFRGNGGNDVYDINTTGATIHIDDFNAGDVINLMGVYGGNVRIDTTRAGKIIVHSNEDVNDNFAINLVGYTSGTITSANISQYIMATTAVVYEPPSFDNPNIITGTNPEGVFDVYDYRGNNDIAVNLNDDAPMVAGVSIVGYEGVAYAMGISGTGTFTASINTSNFFRGSDGGDQFHVLEDTTVAHRLEGKRGNDTFTIASGVETSTVMEDDTEVTNTFSILGGDDNDEINISGGTGITADGGDGSDVFNISGGMDLTLNAGAGDNTGADDVDDNDGDIFNFSTDISVDTTYTIMNFDAGTEMSTEDKIDVRMLFAGEDLATLTTNDTDIFISQGSTSYTFNISGFNINTDGHSIIGASVAPTTDSDMRQIHAFVGDGLLPSLPFASAGTTDIIDASQGSAILTVLYTNDTAQLGSFSPVAFTPANIDGFYGSGGADTFNLSGVSSKLIINGNGGDDMITVATGHTATVIDGGADNDSFLMVDTMAGTYKGGEGADTFTFNRIQGGVTGGTFLGEGGADVFNITVAIGTATITGGAGADEFTASVGVTLGNDEGDDTYTITDGMGHVLSDSMGSNSFDIDGGTGTINLTGATETQTISIAGTTGEWGITLSVAGMATETIDFEGANGNITIHDFGTGDTLNFSNLSNAEIYFAETSADVWEALIYHGTDRSDFFTIAINAQADFDLGASNVGTGAMHRQASADNPIRFILDDNGTTLTLSPMLREYSDFDFIDASSQSGSIYINFRDTGGAVTAFSSTTVDVETVRTVIRNDTLSFAGGDIEGAYGGGSADSFWLHSMEANYVAGRGGDDKFYINGGESHSIDGGGNNDTVIVESGTISDFEINDIEVLDLTALERATHIFENGNIIVTYGDSDASFTITDEKDLSSTNINVMHQAITPSGDDGTAVDMLRIWTPIIRSGIIYDHGATPTANYDVLDLSEATNAITATIGTASMVKIGSSASNTINTGYEGIIGTAMGDNFTANGGRVYFKGGDGADSFTITAGDAININLEDTDDAIDVVELGSATDSVSITNFGAEDTISLNITDADSYRLFNNGTNTEIHVSTNNDDGNLAGLDGDEDDSLVATLVGYTGAVNIVGLTQQHDLPMMPSGMGNLTGGGANDTFTISGMNITADGTANGDDTYLFTATAESVTISNFASGDTINVSGAFSGNVYTRIDTENNKIYVADNAEGTDEKLLATVANLSAGTLDGATGSYDEAMNLMTGEALEERTLVGGSNADTLTIEHANASATGGAGSDTFSITISSDDVSATITDYMTEDSIVLPQTVKDAIDSYRAVVSEGNTLIYISTNNADDGDTSMFSTGETETLFLTLEGATLTTTELMAIFGASKPTHEMPTASSTISGDQTLAFEEANHRYIVDNATPGALTISTVGTFTITETDNTLTITQNRDGMTDIQHTYEFSSTPSGNLFGDITFAAGSTIRADRGLFGTLAPTSLFGDIKIGDASSDDALTNRFETSAGGLVFGSFDNFNEYVSTSDEGNSIVTSGTSLTSIEYGSGDDIVNQLNHSYEVDFGGGTDTFIINNVPDNAEFKLYAGRIERIVSESETFTGTIQNLEHFDIASGMRINEMNLNMTIDIYEDINYSIKTSTNGNYFLDFNNIGGDFVLNDLGKVVATIARTAKIDFTDYSADSGTITLGNDVDNEIKFEDGTKTVNIDLQGDTVIGNITINGTGTADEFVISKAGYVVTGGGGNDTFTFSGTELDDGTITISDFGAGMDEDRLNFSSYTGATYTISSDSMTLSVSDGATNFDIESTNTFSVGDVEGALQASVSATTMTDALTLNGGNNADNFTINLADAVVNLGGDNQGADTISFTLATATNAQINGFTSDDTINLDMEVFKSYRLTDDGTNTTIHVSTDNVGSLTSLDGTETEVIPALATLNGFTGSAPMITGVTEQHVKATTATITDSTAVTGTTANDTFTVTATDANIDGGDGMDTVNLSGSGTLAMVSNVETINVSGLTSNPTHYRIDDSGALWVASNNMETTEGTKVANSGATGVTIQGAQLYTYTPPEPTGPNRNDAEVPLINGGNVSGNNLPNLPSSLDLSGNLDLLSFNQIDANPSIVYNFGAARSNAMVAGDSGSYSIAAGTAAAIASDAGGIGTTAGDTVSLTGFEGVVGAGGTGVFDLGGGVLLNAGGNETVYASTTTNNLFEGRGNRDTFVYTGGERHHVFIGGTNGSPDGADGAAADTLIIEAFSGTTGRVDFLDYFEHSNAFLDDVIMVTSALAGATRTNDGNNIILTNGANILTINLGDASAIGVAVAGLTNDNPNHGGDGGGGTEANQTFTIAENDDTSQAITGGGGDDTLTITGGTGSHSFTGGAGSDAVTISIGTTTNGGSVDFTDFDGTSDTISIESDNAVTYTRTDDNIVFSDGMHTYSVDVQSAESVMGIMGATGSFAISEEGTTANGTNANDEFTIDDQSDGSSMGASYTINGGGGADTLVISHIDNGATVSFANFDSDDRIMIDGYSLGSYTWMQNADMTNIMFTRVGDMHSFVLDLGSTFTVTTEQITTLFPVRFDSSSTTGDSDLWSLMGSGTINRTYTLPADDYTILWDDVVDMIDTQAELEANTHRFTITETMMDGGDFDLVLGFANGSITIDRGSGATSANTDNMDGISFAEFMEAVGSTNLDFS